MCRVSDAGPMIDGAADCEGRRPKASKGGMPHRGPLSGSQGTRFAHAEFFAFCEEAVISPAEIPPRKKFPGI